MNMNYYIGVFLVTVGISYGILFYQRKDQLVLTSISIALIVVGSQIILQPAILELS